jgi:hypothetical protein
LSHIRLCLDLLGCFESVGSLGQRCPRRTCQTSDRFAHRAAAATSHTGSARCGDVGEHLLERACVKKHLAQLTWWHERRVEASGKCCTSLF